MFRNVYAILVFIILASLSAIAYGQDAQIQGQVLDPSGASVPKAIVRVVDQQTSTERKVVAGDNGQYVVPGLTPGSYRIIVEAPGFTPTGSDLVTLSAGKTSIIDFTLKLGTASTDVVVTAEKREESLQNVPVPVSVINTEQLSGSGQVLLRDYFYTVPGFVVSPNIENNQMLSVRGVTTGGFSTPTVGVLIDDVPFASGNEVPDIDPFDLARIEVLRGPQGTLYGADSMGGLIKYVTKDPSAEGFEGRIETGSSMVHNGSEPGYIVRASANLPIRSDLAARVSGFTRQDPGYIDNIFTNQKGVNRAQAEGMRLSLMWFPGNDFLLKLNGLLEQTKADGISEVTKGDGLGDLQQNYIAGLGGPKRTIQAYNATATAKLKNIDLISLTGYNVNQAIEPYDYTPLLGSTTAMFFPTQGTALFDYSHYRKITEELRLSATLWKRLSWMLGGFYTHEDDGESDTISALNETTGQVVGLGMYLPFPSIQEEYAGFGEVTYRVTDRFDVQFGARESHQRETELQATVVGPLVPSSYSVPSPYIAPRADAHSDAFTYLATPRFRISPDLMAYMRFASGYRPGGPNAVLPGIPTQVNPDKTENYELGVKGNLFHNRLAFDSSLYYINWNDIQIQLFTSTGGAYMANGGGAKSEGVELSLASKPIRGFTFEGWGNYDDAALTQMFPKGSTTFGAAGDPLPNTSKWSFNLSPREELALGKGTTGFIGASVSYFGDRKSVFVQGSPLRQDMPAYSNTNLNVGVNYKSWRVTVFGNNVADVRGLLNGGIGYIAPNAFVYTVPRTVGFSLTKTFNQHE